MAKKRITNNLKVLLSSFVVFLICASALILSACANFLDVTIKFDPNYPNAEVITKTYKYGEQVSAPNVTREGYEFDGWYTNRDLTEKAPDKIYAGVSRTYYASWTSTVTLNEITAVYKGQGVFVGGTVSNGDFEVTAFYSDESSEKVNDFVISGFNSDSAGDCSVTISFTKYGVTKQTQVTVAVNKIELTVLTAVYSGESVEVGATLDKSKVSVTAIYGDGSSKIVTDFSAEYDFSSAGEKKVTISYTDGEITKTAEFNITVIEKTVEPPYDRKLISITAVYNGANILVGGSLNNGDFAVTAYYDNESSRIVTNFAVGAFSSAEAGVCAVQISYTENGVTKECSVNVTVVSQGGDVVSNANVSIHFLELGNIYTGDSVYIKAGETDILIDAGSRQSSAGTITKYLNNYVTDGKLEYVIATHAHQDHIAGFIGTSSHRGIFEAFDCETIIDFSRTNQKELTDKGNPTLYKQYLNKRDAAVADGAAHYTAEQCFNETDGAKRVYQIADGITLEILYNYYYFNSSGDENNYSVTCIIKQGENNYFFSGDLEQEGEEKLVSYYENKNEPLPHCVLYKAGHHGSKTSSTAKLMSAITPDYVCVCCCAGTSEYTSNNDNQFPTQDFINRIAPYTDKVYVTTMVDNYVSSGWGSNGTVKSMNGNIVFSCIDGNITVECSNNNLLLKDTEWFKEKRICPEEWKDKQTQ